MSCGATLIPGVLTRTYSKISTEIAVASAIGTDDNVLLAKLNDFYLGGCTSLWSFEVLSHDSKVGCKIFLTAKKVN